MAKRIEGIMRFRHSLYFEASALGEHVGIEVGGVSGALVLPSLPENPLEHFACLVPPRAASRACLRFIEPREWGHVADHELGCRVRCALMYFDFSDDLSDERIKQLAEVINSEFEKWINLFLGWIQSACMEVYRDSWRYDKQEIQLRGVFEGQYSQANITSAGEMLIQFGVRRVSSEVLRESAWFASTGTEIPLEHDLLTRARAGLHDGDFRGAVLDAATACEVALSNLVRDRLDRSSLPEDARKHLFTRVRNLMPLYAMVKKLGVDVPDSLEPTVAKPRNAAIHRGTVIDEATARAAVKTATELLKSLSPMEHIV